MSYAEETVGWVEAFNYGGDAPARITAGAATGLIKGAAAYWIGLLDNPADPAWPSFRAKTEYDNWLNGQIVRNKIDDIAATIAALT